MDRVDRAIIGQLAADGRLSNAELAERVRLSPSACLRRVRALEARGVHRRLPRRDRPGRARPRFQVLVYTTLMLRNRETIAAFEEAVVGLDAVVECHRMFGDPDYVIRVAVADVGAYERFLIDAFADLQGVARMTSQFAMKTIKAAGPLPFRA